MSRKTWSNELSSSSNNAGEKKKEKTMPFDVKLMRSQVPYRAAQDLIGIKVVLARPIVPSIASSLQGIINT